MLPPQLFPLDLFSLQEDYPDGIFENSSKTNSLYLLDDSKNVLVGLVKKDNITQYEDQTANIYYTGKKFPSTVKLNKLYYFMPYTKKKGIRDLYLIKVASVGTKHEVKQECDENDLRLVFEIEFVKQLFNDYKPFKLKIWETFTDTTLKEILESVNNKRIG